MKWNALRWMLAVLAPAMLGSCYYYPAPNGVAGAPTNMPYNPYADEKSGSVAVYDDTYVPPPPPAVPVAPRPSFSLGIVLPPIIFGHHRHHHGHHHGHHHHRH